ncbi:Far upstream element-binding protein 3, partial [Cucurbita argyrosperma subsp. sororia]
MAEEVVVATGAASPEPLDHKRKLADLDNEATEAPQENHGEPNEESPASDNADVAVSDESEAKRPRLDGKPEENASENGHKKRMVEEPAKEDDTSEEDSEHPASLEEVSEREETEKPTAEPNEAGDALDSAEETEQPASLEEVHEKEETEQPTAEPHEAGGAQDSAAEISQEVKTQELSKEENQPPVVEAALPLQQEDGSNSEHGQPSSVAETTTYRMEVPNSKVGVLIGKAGDTIRYLQYNSGAKIQIMRDSDADPNRLSRPVEIVGTSESIKKAEELINAVIAEADAGGSPSLIARGLTSSHSMATAEQIQIQVPNEKVGLIIGRGGETIKSLQTRSGARIQLIPQNLPEGDESKERTIRVTGDKKQIEIATDMIKEVMNQTVRPSPHSTGFNQQAYRPRGPGGNQWGQRGPHPSHPAAYDYPHRGPYPSHNTQYQHPAFGNYPQQMGGPRSSYSSGWEQRPPPSMQGPPPSSGGYDYYGGRSHYSDAPPSHFPGAMPAHAPGPSPAPALGPPQTQSSYNYSQQQNQGYGHAAPYSQAAPHQSYGHGYEQKYDHHAPSQNPYGGHGNAQQLYPQAGAQQVYPGQQQYDKPPSYGAPAQGPPPQSYGAPRVGQPGEPYQGGSAPATYGQNVQPQQTYQYPTGGSTQQYPTPYGIPNTDGYNQAPAAAAAANYHPQQGSQAGYGQPGVQQLSAYGQQVAPAAAYEQYPTTQQGYPEQAAANTAGYAAYQAPQDPAAYSSAQATAAAVYSAPASGQPTYPQQTAAQPSYDQSVPQSGGYGTVPSSAPVGYGKSVSPQPQPQPQPGYPQYDSTQVYGASR